MGTSSYLATFSDARMIELPRPPGAPLTKIYHPGTPLVQMPPFQGNTLKTQLGGRYLVRYLRGDQVGNLVNGIRTRQYVSPTPYSPGEAVKWLALPRPNCPPKFVLLLITDHLRNIRGPRYVLLGGGIEYILEDGFDKNALVSVSADPSNQPRWEISIR